MIYSIFQHFTRLLSGCLLLGLLLGATSSTVSADVQAAHWLDDADRLLQQEFGPYPARERDAIDRARALRDRAALALPRLGHPAALTRSLARVDAGLVRAEAAYVCSVRLADIRALHRAQQPANPRDFRRAEHAMMKLKALGPEARSLVGRYRGALSDLRAANDRLGHIQADAAHLERARRERLRARPAIQRSTALLERAEREARAGRDQGALRDLLLSLHDTTLPDATRAMLQQAAFHAQRRLAFADDDVAAGVALAALTGGRVAGMGRTHGRTRAFRVPVKQNHCYAMFSNLDEGWARLVDVKFFRPLKTPPLSPFVSEGGSAAGAPPIHGFCAAATGTVRIETVVSPGAEARNVVLEFAPRDLPPAVVARLRLPPPRCDQDPATVPGTVAYLGIDPVLIVDPGPVGARYLEVTVPGARTTQRVFRRRLSEKPADKAVPLSVERCAAPSATSIGPDAHTEARLRYLRHERDALN